MFYCLIITFFIWTANTVGNPECAYTVDIENIIDNDVVDKLK